MKKIWLVLLGVIGISETGEAACFAAPTCAEMGYNKTVAECANGGVNCPFDVNKMFCPEIYKACAVGDVLHSDLSCNSTKLATKTAIGVVSYMNGDKRLAINLVDPGSKYWSNSFVDLSLTNYDTETLAKTDFSGKSNTAVWVNYYGASSTYAPGYCYNFTTEGTKKGDWYLPAFGELYASVWANKAAVTVGLGFAGGANLAADYHWSSTEMRYDDAWLVSVSNGATLRTGKSWGPYRVRCVLAF